LPERLNVNKNKTVLNDGDYQRTNHSADNGSGAAKQTRTTDYDGSDAVEQNWFSGLWRTCAKPGGVQNAGAGCRDR
jgi:hypothetical protein